MCRLAEKNTSKGHLHRYVGLAISTCLCSKQLLSRNVVCNYMYTCTMYYDEAILQRNSCTLEISYTLTSIVFVGKHIRSVWAVAS